MTDFLNDWGLTLVTFIPLAGALVAMAVPRAEEEAHKQIALLTTVAAAVFHGLFGRAADQWVGRGTGPRMSAPVRFAVSQMTWAERSNVVGS